MRILFASAEAAPFAKIGGLGDVAYALPRALAKSGEEAAVVMPLYKQIKEAEGENLTFLCDFTLPLSWRQLYCGVFYKKVGDVTYFFIDNEYYFMRESVYGQFDDGERFAFFCKAVLEMLWHIDFCPDVIHANDWQCGLIPLFLNVFYRTEERFSKIRTLFTIHNVEYQGTFPRGFAGEVLGFSEETMPDCIWNGDVNCLYAGIRAANRVTTVSKTYAEELKTAFYGRGLDSVFNEEAHKFCGVINGIDMDLFNPHTDEHLFHRYDVKTMAGKKIGKRRLREMLGLEQEEEVPIFGMVSRLVEHKGLSLVEFVRHELLERPLQLVVLGTGDWHFEDMFRALAADYPGKVSANICYSTDLASKIYAASDFFLMPSKSEPCGLSQMIAMRYGAIPIVRETGGLYDTVSPINIETGEGQGFTFHTYNAHDMLGAVDRALNFYYENKTGLKKVIRNNMEADFSWHKAAGDYLSLYQSI